MLQARSVLAGALLLRVRQLRSGLVLSGLYVALWIAIAWSIAGLLWWRAPGFVPPYFVFVWLSMLMLAFAGTLVIVGVVVRAQGYRLVRRQDDHNSLFRVPIWLKR